MDGAPGIFGGMDRARLEAEVVEQGALAAALNRDVLACRTALLALRGTHLSATQAALVDGAL